MIQLNSNKQFSWLKMLNDLTKSTKTKYKRRDETKIKTNCTALIPTVLLIIMFIKKVEGSLGWEMRKTNPT